jgi:hypothetical protein
LAVRGRQFAGAALKRRTPRQRHMNGISSDKPTRRRRPLGQRSDSDPGCGVRCPATLVVAYQPPRP